LYAHLLCPVRVSCLSPASVLILLNLISLITFGEAPHTGAKLRKWRMCCGRSRRRLKSCS
jgi:hypothetical protein